MLLGCCHCEEPPSESSLSESNPSESAPSASQSQSDSGSTSESTPPPSESDSTPSASVSSDSYELIPAVCLNHFGCEAIPRFVTATISGSPEPGTICHCGMLITTQQLEFCHCVYYPHGGYWVLYYAARKAKVQFITPFICTDSGAYTWCDNRQLSSSCKFYLEVTSTGTVALSTGRITYVDGYQFSVSWYANSVTHNCLTSTITLPWVANIDPFQLTCGFGSAVITPG